MKIIAAVIILAFLAGITLYIFSQNRKIDQRLQEKTKLVVDFKKMNEDLNEKFSKIPVQD